ncbi:MAG: hypothetical protein CAPSK01_000214 [Candidatus Accumulibacter vicinus]|uniref:Uncharacterized protein n=1 Tax=Candidatus Accumulibacter vicinus TaxID=2954382 RepID=A0A084Y5S0_9PROT|nr:MAG: hypothetical protein CAPSK01_000214 [Candidatus Accumulibacter vicinus]
MQNRTINDALGYDGQQFGVRDAVKILRQVGINDLGVAPIKRLCYFIDRIMGRLLRSESVGIRTEIRFKYRLDDQLYRHLGYPVSDRRYPQRTLAAIRLGDHDAPYWTRGVGFIFQVLGQFRQKHLYPCLLLYVLEVHPINAGTPLVGANQAVGMHEDVCPPNLVI